jgi:hypothetical protein|tara:strand:+ start:2110 stop:2472 length:363 start_codon:yes stop_codon:yes gene_type:complete
MTTESKIKSKCKALEKLLVSKNEAYGDSALEPLNVFSAANAISAIKIRIDDKLKRIKNSGLVDATEDTLQDLAGYLILLMIAKDNERNDIQERIRQGEPSRHNPTDSTIEDSGWEVVYHD